METLYNIINSSSLQDVQLACMILLICYGFYLIIKSFQEDAFLGVALLMVMTIISWLVLLGMGSKYVSIVGYAALSLMVILALMIASAVTHAKPIKQRYKYIKNDNGDVSEIVPITGRELVKIERKLNKEEIIEIENQLSKSDRDIELLKSEQWLDFFKTHTGFVAITDNQYGRDKARSIAIDNVIRNKTVLVNRLKSLKGN